MASVTSNQEAGAIPETPTVVGSPGNCGDALYFEEKITFPGKKRWRNRETARRPPVKTIRLICQQEMMQWASLDAHNNQPPGKQRKQTLTRIPSGVRQHAENFPIGG